MSAPAFLRRVAPLMVVLWPLGGLAEPLDARLLAQQDCPAPVSIKRPGNPGDVRLEPGQSYRIMARNKTQPTHYQLRIDGARPQDRWVSVECGRIAVPGQELTEVAPSAVATGSGGTRDRPKAVSMEGQFVLAASWQPAFCERRRDKPECRTQSADRPDARQFSLHGLWPQPIGNSYCKVSAGERRLSESGDWRRLPKLDLDQATRAALALRMPGMASDLQRHEWTKHGTCYGTDADTYFDQAMALLDQLNGSAVQALFEANIGKRLRSGEIRDAFDQTFGAGAGERVRVACDRDGLITELRVGLKGEIAEDSSLGDLIRSAPIRSQGCRGGWVDRAGPGR